MQLQNAPVSHNMRTCLLQIEPDTKACGPPALPVIFHTNPD